MMTSYQEYIAVLKRMKEIEAKGTAELFYYHCSTSGHSQACQDKATIYDAEHDREPATVEWLESIGGKRIDAVGNTLIKFCEFITVWKVEGGLLLTMHGMEMLTNPTRGDVLTALRLFKKEGA